VGKTELAKRIAELYSSSKRLQVYTMGNFTEPHSVSGIIGVPPGYVGHEEGGRLINELRADPYSVFLLDEAEKCHPNVWKPFLNLFDEGWIVDQRGVKAYADRAIFILTTNAGDKNISQLTRSGKSAAEILEALKQALARVRVERSSQPVFPPQFLSRMKRIIVFNPLDEAAMVGIARCAARRLAERWKLARDKVVTLAPELLQSIGRMAHEMNTRANGQEGGRIVQKLFSDCVEHTIYRKSLDDRDGYERCREIRVSLGTTSSPDRIQTEITFHSAVASAVAVSLP
jgi:ATP-dependent Clp protease ATP-binding subunit ClpA